MILSDLKQEYPIAGEKREVLNPTLKRGIWNAASAEDFRVTTLPSGEPVISTMSIVEDTDAPAVFRPDHTDGITAYQLWQLQKERRDIRKRYLDHWNATISVTGTGTFPRYLDTQCS